MVHPMSPETELAALAAAVGDPARSRMLLVLMDGRARTAKELAYLARVSASTASGHLAQLLAGRLVTVAPQGRHRYYRLASEQVGRMIEAMSLVAADDRPPGPGRPWPHGEALRTARTCYDHLAGRLGVALAEALQGRGHVVLADGAGEVTPSGHAFLEAFGCDLDGRAGRRPVCRPCLDWSERRDHLAGQVGAALCARCLELAWVARERDGRALLITPAGRRGFEETFGIRCEALADGFVARAA
jgi:DNA-binding transcriptional ArsR family regulator